MLLQAPGGGTTRPKMHKGDCIGRRGGQQFDEVHEEESSGDGMRWSRRNEGTCLACVAKRLGNRIQREDDIVEHEGNRPCNVSCTLVTMKVESMFQATMMRMDHKWCTWKEQRANLTSRAIAHALLHRVMESRCVPSHAKTVHPACIGLFQPSFPRPRDAWKVIEDPREQREGKCQFSSWLLRSTRLRSRFTAAAGSERGKRTETRAELQQPFFPSRMRNRR